MEATLLGIKAIALSQVRRNGKAVRWATGADHAPDIIRRLTATDWPRNVVVNVNFPDCPPADVTGVAITRQGRRKIGDRLNPGIDPRGNPYIWIGTERDEDPSFPGSDLEAVHAGKISITPLGLDLTHRPTMTALKKVFR
jgi:5'-nucleotidase